MSEDFLRTENVLLIPNSVRNYFNGFKYLDELFNAIKKCKFKRVFCENGPDQVINRVERKREKKKKHFSHISSAQIQRKPSQNVHSQTLQKYKISSNVHDEQKKKSMEMMKTTEMIKMKSFDVIIELK